MLAPICSLYPSLDWPRTIEYADYVRGLVKNNLNLFLFALKNR